MTPLPATTRSTLTGAATRVGATWRNLSRRLPCRRATTTTTRLSRNNNKIDWTIRAATLDDYDAVQALLTKTYQTVLPQFYPESVIQEALPIVCTPQTELLESGTWYVVTHPKNDPTSNSLVGCGGWLATQHPLSNNNNNNEVSSPLAQTVRQASDPTAHCHLRHFATDPDHAHRGIGKTIWQRTVADIIMQTTTTTTTTKNNKPLPRMEVFSSLNAERFYQSLGFERVSKIDLPFTQQCLFPVLVMRRPATNYE